MYYAREARPQGPTGRGLHPGALPQKPCQCLALLHILCDAQVGLMPSGARALAVSVSVLGCVVSQVGIGSNLYVPIYWVGCVGLASALDLGCAVAAPGWPLLEAQGYFRLEAQLMLQSKLGY